MSESGASKGSYLDPYREAVARSGSNFETLLWNSREFQRVRFQTLADIVDLTGRVVADLGAGRADMLEWMHAHGVAYGGYVGVEALAEHVAFMRERARKESLPNAEFVQADFAADRDLFRGLAHDFGAQVLIFSGSLNTFDEEHAREVLGLAWEAVKQIHGGALAFNFLSDRYVPPKGAVPTGPAKRFSPVRMLDWALSESQCVRLRHDYLEGHDATIAMYAATDPAAPART